MSEPGTVPESARRTAARQAERPAAQSPDQAQATVEQRIEQVRRRLAEGPAAELGLHIEPRGQAVAVSGTVTRADTREHVLGVVAQELAGLVVHTDIAVVSVDDGAVPVAEEL